MSLGYKSIAADKGDIDTGCTADYVGIPGKRPGINYEPSMEY
jgi:hypothetical protein